MSPESVTRVPGALRSLIPRVAIPPSTRREFTAAVPVIAAVWMLSGLSGGLAPHPVHLLVQTFLEEFLRHLLAVVERRR